MAIGGAGAGIVIAAADFIEQRVVCKLGPQIGINVRQWYVTAVGGASLTLGQLAGALDSQASVNYTPSIANTAEYRGVGVHKLWPAPGSPEAWSNGAAGFGTGGATPMPGEVSGIITLYTNVKGRKGRGRMYIPFPATAATTVLGEVNLGYGVLLQTIRDVFVGSNPIVVGADSVTLQSVVWNRLTHTALPVVVGYVQPKFAVQHRRGDYGKPNSPPF